MTSLRRSLEALIATGALLVVATATAFQSIGPADAINQVGEAATVCGRVASAKYAESSRGSPTFLNLDRPYPDHIFTAVIWGTSRSRFHSPPEALSGKSICVTGVISIYRGKAQIEVSDPSQIRERR
jgi:DNA/RNA endonuclease YhcR with UshA esterase domain